MGFWIFLLSMDLLIPLSMVGFGWIFLHRPPKEVNGIYGYRTARSMASPEAWAFAHAYMGKIWFRMGIVLMPVTVAVMIPCMGKGDDVAGIVGAILALAECVLLMLPIIPTERALKKRF